jgi:hypothetical protein
VCGLLKVSIYVWPTEDCVCGLLKVSMCDLLRTWCVVSEGQSVWPSEGQSV